MALELIPTMSPGVDEEMAQRVVTLILLTVHGATTQGLTKSRYNETAEGKRTKGNES